MTDIWDFSALLNSWAEKTQQDSTDIQNDDQFAEIKEQLDKELNEISSQIVLAKSNDPTVLNELNLLSPPVQTNNVSLNPPDQQSNQTSNRSQARSSTSLASVSVRSKNTISNNSMASSKLPPLNKSSLAPLPKPKEAMLTKAKRIIKPKIIPKPERIFKATPSELHVINFSLRKEYVLTFTLQNVSSRSHGFQVRGPDDTAFRVRILEDIANSQIRPGIHLTFEVIFYPKEPRDYEGSIIIIPGPDEPSTAIPIRCYRDPPQLVLNDIVDLQATLVYSFKSGSFSITNRGGIASFAFNSVHGQETNSTFVDGPFILSPSRFELDRGESIKIDIQFKPTETGMQKASFEITAEYFPQKFFFLAQGFAAVPKLHFKICDDDRLFLPFLPSDANTSKNIEIYNDSDVSYPFYIQILRPKDITKSELKVLYPEIDTETVKTPPPFTVKPASGIIGARDTVSLNISFTPKMFAFYCSKMVIFAHRIPDESGNLGSRKMLTISTEATAGPPSVSVQPPLVLFNDVIPRIPCQQLVDVVNHSDLNVKLQWRKSEIITPNPVVFEIEPHNKNSVELCLMITKRLSSFTGLVESSSSILQEQKVESRYHTGVSRKSANADSNEIADESSKPSSQNYAITLSPLSRRREQIQQEFENEEGNEEEEKMITEHDEMRHILNVLKKSASYKNHRVIITPTSAKNKASIDKSGNNGLSQISNEMSVNIDSINQMTFTYSAQIAKPNLMFEPPEIDFGCVLAGHKSFQVLHLTNPTGAPIGYTVNYPNKPEWRITNQNGIVETTADIEIELAYESQAAVSDFIAVTTFWIGENGKQIKTFPIKTFTVPVYAVFDRPVIGFDKRIINIGNIYPTIDYQAQIKISLLNQFPTDFSFEEYVNEIRIGAMPLPTNNINQIRSKSQNNRKHPIQHEIQPRASTAIDNQLNSRTENTTQVIEEEEEEFEDNDSIAKEYVKAEPSTQHLDVGDSCDITITANFCHLGQLAVPLKCNVIGKSYICPVLANVQAPKLVLETGKIDFSSDFVICKRSNSYVVVTNECGVESTIRVEMIDDCNNVFALEDSEIKIVKPNETVKIPVSCYSEIHGNYNGQLKLIVQDSWQKKEIMIPLHVKALGSFFGFQKHTVGYIKNDNGDFISFGKKIKCGSEKIIRRITLENFSSDEINVSWSLVNFVKGRHYADVTLDLDDKGLVKLDILPTDQCELQDPFKLLIKESIIESHGKTVIVIEFTPSKAGEFRGCVAARSGEFTHTLDLLAIVCNS